MQDARGRLGDAPHPGDRLLAVGVATQPVEEVGAAVVGDRHPPCQQGVVLERGGEADDLVGGGEVHRVVGQDHQHRVLPAAGVAQHLLEVADQRVGVGQRRPPRRPETRGAGGVSVPEAVDVAEVHEDQVGVVLGDHLHGGLHRGPVGRVPRDRHDGHRLPAVGRAGAEDAVEVLLAEHGPGAVAQPVHPLQQGRRPQVARPVEVAHLAQVTVVDRVGRDAGLVRAHPRHHHRVVRDGLHHRHRGGLAEAQAGVAEPGEVRGDALVELLGQAPVDDQHVGALARRALRSRGRSRRPGRAQSRGEEQPRTAGTEQRPAPGSCLGEPGGHLGRARALAEVIGHWGSPVLRLAGPRRCRRG